MDTQIIYSNYIASTDTTRLPKINGWEVLNSRSYAEIALDRIAFSLSNLSSEELLDGLEETRQSVFEKFYGSIGGN